MKTSEIERVLFTELNFRQNYIVPRVTDNSLLVGFEVDILKVTKSGYASAFEIKVSKSDFKNDFKKRHIIYYNNGNKRFFKGLESFSYVVTEELKDYVLENTNKDFGVYYVIEKDYKYHLICLRSPTIIDRVKWSEKKIFNLLRIATMKLYNCIKEQ